MLKKKEILYKRNENPITSVNTWNCKPLCHMKPARHRKAWVLWSYTCRSLKSRFQQKYQNSFHWGLKQEIGGVLGNGWQLPRPRHKGGVRSNVEKHCGWLSHKNIYFRSSKNRSKFQTHGSFLSISVSETLNIGLFPTISLSCHLHFLCPSYGLPNL